ncbi:uncharacterized protein LOC130421198 [Triplophysa dalaica]|uniref:uncharacterized protein LOC130421198 n=1 Tax=Triplophysa dalaica TaxID=1582913 RepID=UPI0024DFC4E0|nr:uncharacterized protein LOC130421198 [Triplophysa dalaica]
MAFLSVLMLLCAFPLSNAAGRLREFHLLNKTYINETLVTTVCKTNYTDIVTVYDDKDNKELSKLVNTTNGSGAPSALIGAHTINTTYTSKWSNGDDVTFTSFTEKCTCTTEICGAAMRTNGSWELLSFNETKHFMCYNEGVDRSSHNYSLISQNKTWTEAQLYCREHHTDLVSITNEQENERVKNETREFPFWIGLLHDKIEWFDGGRSAYRDKLFYPKEEKGFLISGQGWTQASFPSKYYTLCYKSLIHVSTHEMSWEEALDYCNAPGLLRIESKDDQIETERELRRQKISEPVWIGLRKSRLFGFWMWANGPNVGNWTNWKGGRQPEHQISHHCGVMEKVNGTFKWADKDCRSPFRVFCEIR